MDILLLVFSCFYCIKRLVSLGVWGANFYGVKFFLINIILFLIIYISLVCGC